MIIYLIERLGFSLRSVHRDLIHRNLLTCKNERTIALSASAGQWVSLFSFDGGQDDRRCIDLKDG